jgi:hypothetical protein
VKQINVSVQDETYRAAKGAAGHEGLGFARWIEKTIRSVCGLVEFSLGPELDPPKTPATVHEMTLETRLEALIKQADARKEKP